MYQPLYQVQIPDGVFPGQDTHEKRDTALREYEQLAAATGGAGIKLAQLLL